ncbi:Immunoglobulin-like domain of spore germination [Seinonella peptonophila]|uniref:Immunoglobulin-like domain of spore germination n=1 Tax=Seinonella peptonophila TaxID=112248 RepID=A0A1M5B2K8_9BACL|nr:Gmad2 immunoglobulin-like domain-containing protein [Seinonella peptonophila]SHF36646.1 Immunoglobulin-like domain of spore germination [Seinonella peptonophila]
MKKFSLVFLLLMLLFSTSPAFANPYQKANPAFRQVKVDDPKIQFQIKGEAKVWEATLHYRVKAGKKIVAQGFKTASKGAPQWGKFSLDLTLTKSKVKGKELTLELFEESQANGSEIHKLTIPLKTIDNKKYQNQAFRYVTGSTQYIYHVKGEARVWEATYHYEVSDGHNILKKGYGTASNGAPKWGTFQQTIKIPKKKMRVNGSIILELYEESMKDGSRKNRYFQRLDQFPWK